MINIKDTDLYDLKSAIESLAYQVAQHEYPGQYDWSDEQIATIIRCEGLTVEVED